MNYKFGSYVGGNIHQALAWRNSGKHVKPQTV